MYACPARRCLRPYNRTRPKVRREFRTRGHGGPLHYATAQTGSGVATQSGSAAGTQSGGGAGIQSGSGAGIRARLLLVLLLAAPATAQSLLIRPADVPRLRHAGGIGPALPASEARVRFGVAGEAFNAMRRHLSQTTPEFTVSGDVAAAAFCLLLKPADPAAERWRELISAALSRPFMITTDVFELSLALDWCWDELPAEARTEFARNLREAAQPLEPSDSPLEHRTFRRKLGCLAAAIALDPVRYAAPAFESQRTQLLERADIYFKTVFPKFIAWRGLTPTSPGAGPYEESDTALALELASLLFEKDAWESCRPTVGRWLEHYALATMTHPALQHDFFRDDAGDAPLTPVPAWEGMLPLTAHLIAVRTRDPAAAWVADRVESAAAAQPFRSAAWGWAPMLFDTSGIPRFDPTRMPTARNLNGAIVFRGDGGGLFQTAIWIEACQPFLRRGQHFDAGHFLIHAAGHLVIDAGDDVVLEATPAKQGRQRLGREPGDFDFEQFNVATIAHNCLMLWDPTQLSRWYGRPFEPGGGQRVIEGTCDDFGEPATDEPASLALDPKHRRSTGQLLAYGQHGPAAAGGGPPQGIAAYAALDLTAAYPNRAASRYTREFLFIAPDLLLLVDRVQTAGTQTPISLLQLPARPTVEGRALALERRTAGVENKAGVWVYEAPRRLEWTERDGAIRCLPLLPAGAVVSVVGGPAEKKAVTSGPQAGRNYVGGGPDSFERLVIPSSRHNARNAWYELGEPTVLGSSFGHVLPWGRIEIAPPSRSREHVFVTLLAMGRKDAPPQATAQIERVNEGIEVRIADADTNLTIRLNDGMTVGGDVRAEKPAVWNWTLPDDVTPDAALPVVPTP